MSPGSEREKMPDIFADLRKWLLAGVDGMAKDVRVSMSGDALH